MQKKALITGITGQDGHYLNELLLEKQYQVFGVSRHLPDQANANSKTNYCSVDLIDHKAITELIKTIQPDEIYHLASQSKPGQSWLTPADTTTTNCIGTLALFEGVKQFSPQSRIFIASSSEMYGQITESPQRETTPFYPLNPYAVTKVYVHQMAEVYRKAYGLFISCGILFNHESPRRGLHFITQKVSYAAACLKLGVKTSLHLNEKGVPIISQGKLTLGSTNGKKDWGHAKDYVRAMWGMLQQEKANNYVIGTGKLHSIETLCDITFSHLGLNWRDYVVIDKQLSRPADTGPACADISKAKNELNWEPKISFQEMMIEMVEHQLCSVNDQELKIGND